MATIGHTGDGALETVAPPPSRAWLVGLDGIRGLAALFVVLHHCYLASFPGFPANSGPAWAAWLLYGHLAVLVFMVLSGFSLGIAPSRNGWRIDDLRRYAHRRAWRILPPYWPALLFSVILAWAFVPEPGEGLPGARSVLIYGLLLQDVFGAPSPNGAFWSIAIEAQLYVVLPLLLLILRRAGIAVVLATVLVPVLVIGVFAPLVPAVNMFMRFTPQFAVAFAVGIVAAGAVQNARLARYPWSWLAVVALAPGIALIAVMGSAWTVPHYFWVDLALAPGVAAMIIAIAVGHPRHVVRFLDTRPIRSLGGFSYSLYLIHAPIIVAISTLVVVPRFGHGLHAFAIALLLGVPSTLLVARLFAGLFDLPFQRHKSWGALGAAMRARLRRPQARMLRAETG
jgi:peptidoglycan/LPS O-acetylase OafA/YrhL